MVAAITAASNAASLLEYSCSALPSWSTDHAPFFAAQAIFILCFAGIGISFYPYMVPTSVTIWDAAAPDSSLSFMLVGACFLVPIILAYTAFAYWVFRGKVTGAFGYH